MFKNKTRLKKTHFTCQSNIPGLLSGAVLWTSEAMQRLFWQFRGRDLSNKSEEKCLQCGEADLDEGRDDHLHRLVDDLEAVGVVQPHDIGSHEGEDGHDVVQHLLLQEGVDESDDDASMV